ncbi:MAG: hypothetical protein ACREKM_03295, partial [Longimicrobiales bacterium]
AVACVAGADGDRDALSDVCEVAFARAFAPVLRIAPDACNRDTNLDAPRLAGEYLFGVRPVSADTVRIVYLPAYHRDCGWSGPKCALGVMDCSSHSGDSELIALTVARDARTWQTVAVFLSAHCFGASAVNCRWYEGESLGRVEWALTPRGAPVVWVAEGRNANYPSRAVCDGGHWLFDTCDRNDARLQYPIEPGRDIGSAAYPISVDGCVTRAELAGENPSIEAAAGVECFWSDIAFTGWQVPAYGAATPYIHYLRMVFEKAR